mgnify:CR=1 FL=1
MREYTKPYLTVEQQISLLQERGMLIEDPVAAREALSQVSYYRLSAYWYPFRKEDCSDQFKPGTSFSEVLRIYEFDRRLRLVVLDGIEGVEVRVRTCLIDVIGWLFGPFGHRDEEVARDKTTHRDWLNRLDEEVGRSKEVFISHFRSTYLGYPKIPIWMALEVASLGSLSKLFSNLVSDLQARICNKLSAPHPVVFGSWLHSLTYVRNICAHHSRLWNRELAVAPKWPAKENQHRAPPKRIYTLLLIVHQLLQQTSIQKRWHLEVCRLLGEAKPAWRKGMGVPENWEETGPFSRHPEVS